MELVSVKNTLSTHITENTAINKIETFVRAIPNYQSLRNDTEFILYVCRALLAEIKKLDNIPDIVLKLLTRVFNLNQDEQKAVSNQITYFINNKKIKLPKLTKKSIFYVSDWIKRKIG
jgi:hypothetical protein